GSLSRSREVMAMEPSAATAVPVTAASSAGTGAPAGSGTHAAQRREGRSRAGLSAASARGRSWELRGVISIAASVGRSDRQDIAGRGADPGGRSAGLGGRRVAEDLGQLASGG